MDNFDMPMEELASLAKTAGGDVQILIQKREKYDTKTFCRLRLEEIAQMVEADEITTVVSTTAWPPQEMPI